MLGPRVSSQLLEFRNATALKAIQQRPFTEACLIHDSAHITLGATGDHVGKVQTALHLLDHA